MTNSTNAVEKDELSQLTDILAPLKANIEETNTALANIQNLFEQKFKRQQSEIANLQTRVQNLEARLSYQEYITDLHDRKIDDQEQVSRKVNLRLKGIEVKRGDSPETLMGFIKSELLKLGLNIPEGEIDRCHRVGKPYTWRDFVNSANNRRVQDVLVKFRTWNSRNIMYQNRTKFPFKVFADLTTRRSNLLDNIRDLVNVDADEVPNIPSVSRVVDFVYADMNCKIKFRSNKGKFYTISSMQEFLNLIDRLDYDLTASDIFKTDESNRLNYAKLEDKGTLEEIYY